MTISLNPVLGNHVTVNPGLSFTTMLPLCQALNPVLCHDCYSTQALSFTSYCVNPGSIIYHHVSC